jgi:DNA processing protein
MAEVTSRTRAWLTLALVPGLGPAQARRLADRHGSPEAACALSPGALREAGVAAEAVAGWSQARTGAVRELDRLAGLGASLLAWDEPTYPARLRAIADPPLVLAVRGLLDAEAPAVAVVGARRASAYGRRVAEELAHGLAAVGITVVSGLATGIDAAAHRGALTARGQTVAVLATGVDGVYPPWHAGLAREVAASGALVSEFAYGTPPLPHHFPRRNRVISGLAIGTVVVEATPGSGSLITARCALEQGREVFAIPGPVGVALHEGTHRLIREGATLVRGVEDVLDEIAPALRQRLAAARASMAAAMLSDVESRVMAAVRAAGAHIDDVIRCTALEPGPALETLLALELRGLLEQQPGMRFRARAA